MCQTPTIIDTGRPEAPTTEATPYGYEPCPCCGGEGWVMTTGSAPDASVGWLGEAGGAEDCGNCDRGLVAIETAPPVGEPVREVAA